MDNKPLIGVDLDTDNSPLALFFNDLFENFKETGFDVVHADQVDALEQNQIGNGTWGVFVDSEGERGYWVMAEGGTFVAMESGSTFSYDYDWTDDHFDVEIDEDNPYLLIYTVMAKYLPEDVLPDRYVEDDAEDEGARLASSVDAEDDIDD